MSPKVVSTHAFTGEPVRETRAVAPRIFTDSDDHALIQARLGLFYGIVGCVVLGFWVAAAVWLAIAMPSRWLEIHAHPAKIGHLFIAIVLVTWWYVARKKAFPRWALAAVDLVAFVKAMVIAAVITAVAPVGLRAETVSVTALLFMSVLRAALVPSPPRWTAFVTAMAAIPVPVGAWIAASRDPTWNDALVPRSSILVLVGGWACASIVSAWVVSRIVYGLRSEVKSAMRLGQYTLEDKIGEGGMGAVYRARHALLRRPTAVKLLDPARGAAASVKRFEREVQITSRLTHPNTIAIYDYGHAQNGIFYYAMELLDGVTLHELVEEDGPQPASRVIHVLAQAASALAEAHDAQLIHRDIKPANIFLCERGGIPDFVKVLDFGLVKDTSAPADLALSNVNTIAGTPLTMAPELITSPESADARVDLYALGAVAYFLLAGRPPFEGQNLVEICSAHLHLAPPALATVGAVDVPPELEELVMKCLAKSPSERPESARALAQKLRELAEDHPWPMEKAERWWAHRRAQA